MFICRTVLDQAENLQLFIIWSFPTDSVLPLAEPKEVEDDVQDVLALAKVNPTTHAFSRILTFWSLGYKDH